MPITPQTPGVADHAAPDPTAQTTPEPLVTVEAVRWLILAIVGAKWAGAVELPDPVLDIVANGLAGFIGLGVSAALTMIARGKVWAMRRGVDVDQVVDEVQRRSATS